MNMMYELYSILRYVEWKIWILSFLVSKKNKLFYVQFLYQKFFPFDDVVYLYLLSVL